MNQDLVGQWIHMATRSRDRQTRDVLTYVRTLECEIGRLTNMLQRQAGLPQDAFTGVAELAAIEIQDEPCMPPPDSRNRAHPVWLSALFIVAALFATSCKEVRHVVSTPEKPRYASATGGATYGMTKNKPELIEVALASHRRELKIAPDGTLTIYLGGTLQGVTVRRVVVRGVGE